MPRLPRIHEDNALYHVMARGNNKQEIFLHEPDYYLYLNLLEKYSVKHGVIVHAYTLLPNHVHLLLQVGTKPLSRLMQVLQQTYTQAFNKLYGRVGHVFQGRYKALLVEDDAYLLQLVKYIHLNPIEAGICTDPAEYPWSSHRHYATGNGLGKVCTGFVESVLAAYGTNMIDGYQLLPKKPEGAVGVGMIERKTAPQSQNHAAIGLEDLLSMVAAAVGIPPESIRGRGKSSDIAKGRRVFIYCAAYLVGYRMTEVAVFLGKSSGLMSMAADSVSQRLLEEDPAWERPVQIIKQRLALLVSEPGCHKEITKET